MSTMMMVFSSPSPSPSPYPSPSSSPMPAIISRLSPFNICSAALTTPAAASYKLNFGGVSPQQKQFLVVNSGVRVGARVSPHPSLHPRPRRLMVASARTILCSSSVSTTSVPDAPTSPTLREDEQPPPSPQTSSSSSSSDAEPSEPESKEEKPARAVVELPTNRIANPVSLIVGASRGLGLEFTRQILARYPDSPVVATCRNPSTAENLMALKEKYPSQLTVMKLDVTDERTAEEVAKEILDRYGRLDLYINTVGVLHIPDGMQPEKKIDELSRDNAILAYQTNAIGPAVVAKHMLPLLKFGQGEGSGRGGAVLAHLTAKVGSIYDNKQGGWYSYRASKAGLNQLTRTIGVECLRLKEPVIVVLLHPGPVDTDLSKPFSRNVSSEKLFTPSASVEKLLGVIDSLKPEDCAKFFNYEKFELPW